MLSKDTLTRAISARFVDIYKDYECHIMEDEEILFSGKSFFGNSIIGSFYGKNKEEKSYLYSFVSQSVSMQYFDRNISYRTVIDEAALLVYVIKDYEDNITSAFLIDKESIEATHYPTEKSFFLSEFDIDSLVKSRNISFLLNGKRAEKGRVSANRAAYIEKCILGILGKIKLLPGINDIGTGIEFYSLPSTNGSFSLNYAMDFSYENSQHKQSDFIGLGNDYVSMVFSEKRNELVSVINNSEPYSYPNVNRMMKRIDSIYKFRNHEYIASQALQNLVKRLYEGVEYVGDLSAEAKGGEFESLSVLSGNGISLRKIAKIDSSDNVSIEASFKDVALKIEDTVEDSDYKEYLVEIVSIDRDTRKGKLDFKDTLYLGQSSRFVIDGSGPLHESIYTRSLDRKSEITVIGKAKRLRINRERIKFMTIKLAS